MIYVYREVANISNNEFATILNVRLKDPTRTCRLATFKIKRKDFATRLATAACTQALRAPK